MRGLYTTILLVFIFSGTQAVMYSWSGLQRIYDNTTDTVHVNVSGMPAVIDTNYGIAHICFDITHTYDGDLSIRLVSPAGTSVNLINAKGGSGNNFSGTCVGMDGTSFSNTTSPFTGIFVPIGDVSSFNNGQNPNGDWLFIVSDNAAQDTGSLHSVTLEFLSNPPRSSGTGTASVPTGTFVWPGVVCPGNAASCDLLPDMTSSAQEIQFNHNETPGFLYVSNATPNIGYGPMEIYGIDSCFCDTIPVVCGTPCPLGQEQHQVIRQRVYHKQAGTDTLTYFDHSAGRMTYHPTHGHLHVDDWADFTLRTATSDPDARNWPIIGTSTKQSFCLINLGTCPGNAGECKDANGNNVTTVPNQNMGFMTGCGLNQGIYVGNYDVYSMSLNDPIVLNNVCNGVYYIVSITDPENNFLESNENNNWVAVPITLTQQSPAPSINASGSTELCPGDSLTLTATIASNYLWSTGATTQSIVVHNSGTYTVSTTCGASVSTSSPVNITTRQLSVNASSVPAVICSGATVQLNSTVSSNAVVTNQTTFTNNQQVFIPDNFTTGVTSPITVSGINPGTLNSSSIISVSLNLTHTYDGDLIISLIAPGGNSILLSNRRGGGGDNFTNTVFSMSAATLIANGTAPFTGSYKPDGTFASLTGNINGTWQLRVQDVAQVDTGRIRNWSITLSNSGQETFAYNWTSVPAGFTSTQQNPLVNPVQSTQYIVTATSSYTGCSVTSTIPVDVTSIISFAPSSGAAGTNIILTGDGLSAVINVTIGGLNCSFVIVNDNQLSITSGANSGVICISTPACTLCSQTAFTASVNNIDVNVKVFIEGFYLGNGTMAATVNPGLYPQLCDTVIVELRNTLSPYAVAYSKKGTIDINGNGVFDFPSSAAGQNYFIAVHHRNAIETWSANPVFVFNNITYDFTNLASKAYGSNMAHLADGKFAMFSGDIADANTNIVGQQDGVVEAIDYLEMENAVGVILLGYIPQDLTGDQVVEAMDYLVEENNVMALVFVMRP
jgi:subtilisin-like proprotein convertase family protein